MADFDDVERIAGALPGVTEGRKWNQRHWLVAEKGFVWERPFGKADVKRFGSQPVPAGPILGVGTEDLDEKAAILEEHPGVVFTIPHFEGYPAVLVHLEVCPLDVLDDLVINAYLVKAPEHLAREVLGPDTGDT